MLSMKSNGRFRVFSHPYSRVGSSVVTYEPELVSIPVMGSSAVPLVSVLSGRPANLLQDIDPKMLLGDAGLCIASQSTSPTYTDVRLTKSKACNAAVETRKEG